MALKIRKKCSCNVLFYFKHENKCKCTMSFGSAVFVLFECSLPQSVSTVSHTFPHQPTIRQKPPMDAPCQSLKLTKQSTGFCLKHEKHNKQMDGISDLGEYIPHHTYFSPRRCFGRLRVPKLQI